MSDGARQWTPTGRVTLAVRRDPHLAAFGFRELIRRVWPNLDRRDIERASEYYADQYGKWI